MIQRLRVRWVAVLASVFAACAHAQTALPFKPEGDAKGWEAWVAVAVIAVLAIVLVAAKRWKAGSMGFLRRTDEAPRVTHSVALGVGSRLVEVEYRGERLLLGVTGSRIELLKTGPSEARGGEPR